MLDCFRVKLPSSTDDYYCCSCLCMQPLNARISAAIQTPHQPVLGLGRSRRSLFLCTLGHHSNDLPTRASRLQYYYCTVLLKPAVILHLLPFPSLPFLPPSHGRCLASISQPPRDSSSRALTDRWCARHLNSLDTLLIIRLPAPIPLSSCPKYSLRVYFPIYKPWHCKRLAASSR